MGTGTPSAGSNESQWQSTADIAAPQYRHPQVPKQDDVQSWSVETDSWADDLPMPGSYRPEVQAEQPAPTTGPPPPPQGVPMERFGPERVGMFRILITSLVGVALLWYAMVALLLSTLFNAFGGDGGGLQWHVALAIVASWLCFSFGVAQNESLSRGLAGGAMALIGTVVLTVVASIVMAFFTDEGVLALIASYVIAATLTRMGRMTLIERRARESYRPFPMV